MTPEAAVARLAEILAARAEFTEDEVYDAMVAAGIPAPVADRAYKFTQIACARALLDGIGVKFSPDYLCFNAAGEVIESGRLAEQPYFAAATALAKSRPAGLQRLALMSSEVHAVNEMLNSGSKPENIVTAPPALFMEAPTPAGMERARRVMTERLPARPRKPWWRFW